MSGPEGEKPRRGVGPSRVIPFRAYLPPELPTDPNALLEVLWGAMGPQLIRYAEAFAPHDEAADIVQNAFCVLWQRHLPAEARPHEVDYAAILWKTVRSRCLDYLRNAKTKRSVLDQFRHVAAERIPGWMNPFRERQRAEAADFLRDALAQIDPRSREIFVMKHLSHLTVSTIAERLGMKRTTVMGMLQRANEAVGSHALRTGYRRKLGAGGSDND